jgi:hypothetical protein
MEATKISNSAIEVTKTVPTAAPTKVIYERGFIENQIIQIKKQKDNDNIQRDLELAECQEILKAMDELGIIPKPLMVAE